MTQRTIVRVHFKDLSIDDEDVLKESIERGCDRLVEEFPEITRCEISLEPDGQGFTAHAHVTAKGSDMATEATASEPRPATDLVLDRVERQLRRAHDKRIFSQRRDAQRDPPKRKAH